MRRASTAVLLPAFLALALASCAEPRVGDGAQGAPGPGAAAGLGPTVRAFTNARIWTGTGAPALEAGTVVSRAGIILEVGPSASVVVPPDAEVIELGGRWLLPGLIDAHGHVNDSGDRSSIPEQLEIYAHYGVTTVLSLGDDAEHMREERWSPQLRRARLFVSGPSLRPPSPAAAAGEVARVSAMGVDWVKMHVTGSRGRETHAAVIAAAHARNLPVAVHITELQDAKSVVNAGAALVAHSVRDLPVDEELIDLMRASGACLVPTLTRELSTFVYAERPDFFDDPFFLERSAPPRLDSFLTPRRQAQSRSASAEYWRESLPLAMENMVQLHRAGVEIAMGTDTGPTGRFQGYFEHLELEIMVDAGLTPEEALTSATSVAARCIGLDGVVGTIRPGAWADFLVLNRDPREDILGTRDIHGVWIAANRVR